MFFCCGITDTGNTRPHNEDSFLINKIVMTHAAMESNLSEPFIIGVADGVAGESSGEIASKLCLELLSNIKFSKDTDLKKKLAFIHENLRSYGISHDGTLNMQTTLCALAIDEDGVGYSVNVGDSRLYRYRNCTLTQISKDQSLVELLCDAGEISREETHSHAQKHVIFPVLGNVSSPPVPDIKEIGAITEDDLILICTDGLSDYVPVNDIESVLAKPIKLPKKLEQLVKLALRKGSRDNITIVALTAHE